MLNNKAEDSVFTLETDHIFESWRNTKILIDRLLSLPEGIIFDDGNKTFITFAQGLLRNSVGDARASNFEEFKRDILIAHNLLRTVIDTATVCKKRNRLNIF